MYKEIALNGKLITTDFTMFNQTGVGSWVKQKQG